MKKFVCSVCGYVHEGAAPPQSCPVCRAPASKFTNRNALLLRYGIIGFSVIAGMAVLIKAGDARSKDKEEGHNHDET